VTLLQPGDPAPPFALRDQDEVLVDRESLRGRRVVLYFYPAAMTPGCTRQACDFRDSLNALSRAGLSVVGVSRDEPARLRAFRDRDRLTFPLLSDPDHAVHAAYGAWGMKTQYGRTAEGAIRSTIVIDENGVVEHALYNVKASGHVARLRALLGVDT
jgi:peroxiredoxin Q/BCP